ncbi:MAG: hypothetical protein ABIA63_05230 [bacterium]
MIPRYFFFIVLIFVLYACGQERAAFYKDGPLIARIDILSGYTIASANEDCYKSKTPHLWPKYLTIGLNPLFAFNLPLDVFLGYDRYYFSSSLKSNSPQLRSSVKFNLVSNALYLGIGKQVTRLFDLNVGIYSGSASIKTSFNSKQEVTDKKSYTNIGAGIDLNVGRLFDIYDPALLYFNHVKLGIHLRKSGLNFMGISTNHDSTQIVKKLSFYSPVISLNLSFFIKQRIKLKASKAPEKTVQNLQTAVKIEPQAKTAPRKEITKPAPIQNKQPASTEKISLPYYSTHPSRRSNLKVLNMVDIEIPDSLTVFNTPEISALGEINSEMIIMNLKNNAPVSIIIDNDSLVNEFLARVLGVYITGRKKNYVIPINKVQVIKEQDASLVEFHFEDFEGAWIDFIRSPCFAHAGLIDNLIKYLGESAFSDKFLNLFKEYDNPIWVKLSKLEKAASTDSSAGHYLNFRYEFKEWNSLMDSATSLAESGSWDAAGSLLQRLEDSYCDYGRFYYLKALSSKQNNEIETAKKMFIKTLERINKRYPDNPLGPIVLYEMGKDFIG